MKKLLLIDAYAMIFRAYYAFIRALRMNSKGENTSAVFGFVMTLDDLIRKIHPTHLGVAFDPAGGTFRHEAFEQYKAQRPETPEDIRKAVPVIKQTFSKLTGLPRAPFQESVPSADHALGRAASDRRSHGSQASARSAARLHQTG